MLKLKEIKCKKKALVIGLSITALIIGIILFVYLFLRYTYNKDLLTNNTVNNESSSYVPEQSTEPEEAEEDYGIESDTVNILLVGVDTRGAFDDSRTDSMIIATIDPTEKKVKLTSLMRDMYVEIPKHGYQKINAAFEIGGIDLLEKTIKYNFGLTLDKYVAIDFQGFQNLIDTLDGVELDVKDYEVKEINKYIKEVNGDNSTMLEGSGVQELNGQQALSYCRIRKVGNNDYERTERQRRVLSLLLDKIKDTKVTSYPKLYSTLSSYIKTNIPFNSMLKLVYTVYKFDGTSTDSFRLPVDDHFKDTSLDGMSVLIPELKYNASELYKFIYNTVPDKLTVPDNSKVYNADIERAKQESEVQTPAPTQTQPATQTTTRPPAEQTPATGTAPPATGTTPPAKDTTPPTTGTTPGTDKPVTPPAAGTGGGTNP
jgi:LCP family protein required for cell wall assembly